MSRLFNWMHSEKTSDEPHYEQELLPIVSENRPEENNIPLTQNANETRILVGNYGAHSEAQPIASTFIATPVFCDDKAHELSEKLAGIMQDLEKRRSKNPARQKRDYALYKVANDLSKLLDVIGPARGAMLRPRPIQALGNLLKKIEGIVAKIERLAQAEIATFDTNTLLELNPNNTLINDIERLIETLFPTENDVIFLIDKMEKCSNLGKKVTSTLGTFIGLALLIYGLATKEISFFVIGIACVLFSAILFTMLHMGTDTIKCQTGTPLNTIAQTANTEETASLVAIKKQGGVLAQLEKSLKQAINEQLEVPPIFIHGYNMLPSLDPSAPHLFQPVVKLSVFGDEATQKAATEKRRCEYETIEGETGQINSKFDDFLRDQNTFY